MSVKHSDSMQRGLKNRHIQLIALGGAIGTGLFYGSAATIKIAGPAIILSYIIGGLIAFWIMRQMGEMSVAEPVSGSFSHFAYKYWGEFPGFVAGWNYWMCYIIVSMAELTAIGIYMQYWWPELPAWISALACLVLITLVNLVNVKLYGEFEFWFAIIKVVAIIGMIIFGGVLVFTGLGGEAIGISNLWAHGGFFPNGLSGLILSLAIVIFSFGGIELIGITAGEADNPKKSIPKAINQVVWRILIFYVGALSILMMLYPWDKVGLDGSPFVQIFSKMGIPSAATILNIVVLTAALSVYNSGIYSNGRMLYGLAKQGNAPQIFTKLNNKGVPYIGILTSSLCTLIAVVLIYLVPDKVFMYVMSLAVLACIINWLMITVAHLKFCKAKNAEGESREFASPWYPYTNYICLAYIAMVFCIMAFMEDMQISVYLAPVWFVILWLGFKVKKLRV